MSPRSKQLIGNTLSVLGVLPLFLWQTELVLMSFQVGIPKGAAFGLSDAMIIGALAVFAYLFAVVIAVPACMYTRRLVRLNPTLPKNFSKGSRMVVAIVIAVPLLVAAFEYLKLIGHALRGSAS